MYLFSFLIFFGTQRAKVRQNIPSSALASRTLIPENYLVPSLHFSILYLKENHVYFKEMSCGSVERTNDLTNHSIYITSKEYGKCESITGMLRIPMEI